MTGIRLSKRDEEIIKFVNQFRCVDRDSLAQLFFGTLKNPINGCNSVMVRLYRLGLVQRTQQYSPTVYLAAESKIKKNSQKILHYLAILDTYKRLCAYSTPRNVIVEDKVGAKGSVEPDLFCIFKSTPFYFEIQRTTYTQAQIDEKVRRYENYYLSDRWQELSWQPVDRPIFPVVAIITDTRYQIDSKYIRFIQVGSIDELMQRFGGANTARSVKSTGGGIRINLT